MIFLQSFLVSYDLAVSSFFDVGFWCGHVVIKSQDTIAILT